MAILRVENDKHLLTVAFVFGILIDHTCPGRAPNFSIGPRSSPTQTWAFFLLPGTMWGRVGSQTKQNVQGRSSQDSNVALINDVDGRNLSKEKSKDEQTEKSPPLTKDTKTVRKSTLLRSVWVIIAIVLIIILGIVAVYYWILFYPILCKKERKYDVMQMSAKP